MQGSRCCRTDVFFSLPEDVQLLVLQVWIGCLYESTFMLMLSRLDIACCCRALRPAFLSLVAHPAHDWKDRESTSWTTNSATGKLAYLRWLHSRHIAVRALLISELQLVAGRQTSFTLPAVTAIEFSSVFTCNDNHLGALLAMCPNITSIAFSAAPRHNPPRSALSTITSALGLTRHSDITQCLSRCTHLQALDIHLGSISVHSLIALLGQCPGLTQLTLREFSNTTQSMDDILQVKQLRHFAVIHWRYHGSHDHFTRLVADHPWLDHIQLASQALNRPGKYLSLLPGVFATMNALQELLDACKDVTKLKLNLLCWYGHTAIVSAPFRLRRIGDTLHYLTDVTIVCDFDYNLEMPEEDVLNIAVSSTWLTRLELVGHILTDAGLHMLARSCLLLQQLIAEGTILCPNKITDAGIAELLAGCSELKELNVNYSPRVTDISREAAAGREGLKFTHFATMPVYSMAGFDMYGKSKRR